jgi:hypothetical protein
LQKDLETALAKAPKGADMAAWRENLIADVVQRHGDDAMASLSRDALDYEDRARVQLALAMLLAASDQVEDAVVHFEGAKATLEEWLAEQPDDRRLQAALVDCCEQLTVALQRAGQGKAALASGARAVELRDRMADGQHANAAEQIDALSTQYLAPASTDALAAIDALTRQVMDDWPGDPQGIYEAACRLTQRPATLSAPIDEPDD